MAILAAAYAEHRRLLDDASLALEPLIIRAATITGSADSMQLLPQKTKPRRLRVFAFPQISLFVQ